MHVHAASTPRQCADASNQMRSAAARNTAAERFAGHRLTVDKGRATPESWMGPVASLNSRNLVSPSVAHTAVSTLDCTHARSVTDVRDLAYITQYGKHADTSDGLFPMQISPSVRRRVVWTHWPRSSRNDHT